MAYDRSEPRVALIAKIGVIALVSLVGIKLALDSYLSLIHISEPTRPY